MILVHVENIMLLGEQNQAINKKGQVTLPAKMRAELGGDLVITRGFERNLLLFPAEAWRALADKLLAQPISNQDVRLLRRRLFSSAEEVALDTRNRILLPPALREFAGINGEVILAGMFDYLELWSTEAWRPVLESVNERVDSARWDGIGI